MDEFIFSAGRFAAHADEEKQSIVVLDPQLFCDCNAVLEDLAELVIVLVLVDQEWGQILSLRVMVTFRESEAGFEYEN